MFFGKFVWCTQYINTLRPRHNGRYFPDDIFECIFLKENVWIPIKISLKFAPKGPINNIPALVQIMAWCWPGDKPLSETMLVFVPTHICVTRPQWVNRNNVDLSPIRPVRIHFNEILSTSIKIVLKKICLNCNLYVKCSIFFSDFSVLPPNQSLVYRTLSSVLHVLGFKLNDISVYAFRVITSEHLFWPPCIVFHYACVVKCVMTHTSGLVYVNLIKITRHVQAITCYMITHMDRGKTQLWHFTRLWRMVRKQTRDFKFSLAALEVVILTMGQGVQLHNELCLLAILYYRIMSALNSCCC